MTGTLAPTVRSRRVAAVLGLVLVALSMRAAIAVVGPLFGAISGELEIDVVTLSLLGAAPPFGFAIAGLFVPGLARRIGLEPALLVAFVVLVVAQGARALSVDAAGLVVSTFLGVLGIGVANVLLPPFLRAWFPRHVGGVTALYLVLVGVGAAIPAFAGVGIAEAIGWRPALAVWIAMPLLALLPLWLLRRGAVAVDEEAGDLAGAPARTARPLATSPTAWAVVAMMLMPSVSTYAASAILPAILVDTAHVSAAVGGASLGVLYLVSLLPPLLVPIVQRRPRTLLLFSAVAGASALVGWGGLLVAPAAAPYLWAALIGLVSITFPLAMLLVNTRSRAPRTTVALSGFTQGVAYVGTGLATVGVGLLHELTGSWTASLVALAATAVLMIPAIAVLARGRHVDDETEDPRR